MKRAATGHRPDKLGGYGPAVAARLRRGATRFLEGRRNTTEAVGGMALGWDTAWALAALDVGVPLVAALPFKGQESRWPVESQRLYHWILERAAEVVIVCPGGYSPDKMQRRNEWMVDRCDELAALWDGSAGGTANCVAYADQVGRPVVNLWPDWARILTPAPRP
jgi:predicted Rossmann fold nucleotide-binding protein DprA/Smf involved in DNA uptake